jgi:DNA-directed RNA polymerase
MSIIDRQIEREKQAVTRGVARFFEALEKDRAKDREFDGPVGQRLVRRVMQTYVPAVRDLQKEARKHIVQGATTGRRLGGWEMPLQTLSPEALAYIGVRTAITSFKKRRTRHRMGRHVGITVNLEARWAEARDGEKTRLKGDDPDPKFNRIEGLKRTVKQINPKSLRLWLKRLDDLETTIWPDETHVKLGAQLITLLVETCPETFEFRIVHNSKAGQIRSLVTLQLTEEADLKLDEANCAFSEEHPWYEPMIVPPLDWRLHEGAYVGGYYALEHRGLMKKNRHAHTRAVLGEYPVPAVVLEALNKVQRTPWQINRRVMEVALLARTRRVAEVLPVAPERDLPPEVTPDVWEALTREERGKIKNDRRRVHDNNNRLDAKRQALRRQLAVAETHVDEPAIYFPHNLDFRGRMYPLPQDLHPQADDFGRGLLVFAERKPLGSAGFMWLCYHAANCYGVDKVSRDEQFAWVASNLNQLSLVARDPLGAGLEFWAQADEPWQFLAAAIELDNAFNWGEPGEEAQYPSNLPVHVDGSCNGLQHLSAMGLDPVGAHATNLTPDPVRQDIYQIVADKVNLKITSHCDAWNCHHELGWDVVPGPEVAKNWAGLVDRKVVKRGVMTVPYGLTDIGMRDQLIEDRWTEDLEGDAHKNAAYLRDLMKEAIEDTVIKATEIMGWMQDNATILAKNGKPVTWETPTGFVIRQAYYNTAIKRVSTIVGVGQYAPRELSYHDEDKTLGFQVKKQSSSIAPNIIHSFDAAHMMQTIAAAGDLSFSVIHDSFGVHASDMPEFLNVIRQEFVAIYKEDWFANLQADFEASRQGADFPLLPPPDRGDFKVEQVTRAEFFFA